VKFLSSFLSSGAVFLALGAFQPAQADLVAWWPLDEDASDATGNGHDGEVVGGDVIFGQPGANLGTGLSASFPDNGHIDVPFSEDLNPGTQEENGSGSFTIALWVNANSAEGNFNSPVTAREDNGQTVNGPIIYNTPANVWSFWAGNNGPPGAWNSLDHDSGTEPGTWQHIAITYDSDEILRTLYVDGEVAQTSDLGISANALRDLHIGSGQDDGNNFFWDGLIDDVGFWDEALTLEAIQAVMNGGIGGSQTDPNLSVASITQLTLDGSVQQFAIKVKNGGETQDLTISAVSFDGTNAANFSLISLPAAAIEPGETSEISINFDPMGATGGFEATMKISSSDPASPEKEVRLTGVIHDPMIATDTILSFGEFPAGAGAQTATITINNSGATQPLKISGIEISGPHADNYSVKNFPAEVAAGGSAQATIGFDPMGGEGTFLATLTINSDDPVAAATGIGVVAKVAITEILIAHWPLDTDASDASGNGHDGTVVGGEVEFGQPGANGATGTAASFPDNGHIDIPFSPELNPGTQEPDGAGSFTVTVWCNATDTGGFNSPFTAREDSGASVNGPIIYNTPENVWSFWGGNNGPSGAWNPLNHTEGTTEGTWQHIAISYDSETLTKTLYVDGEVAQMSEGTGISPNAVRDLHIGAGQDDGNNFFWNGLLDDVGYFRVALSADEIQKVMENGVAGASGGFVFQITELKLAGNTVNLSFTSRAGATYSIERTTALDGAWGELDDGIESQGDITEFTDPTLPDPIPASLYYRVIQQ
jgi:hypothetical protein